MFFYSCSLQAQKKYALLIGINDYYEQPGVKSSHSLKGCVSDANSMKAILINRFGFNPTNISTLYNADATKKNVIDRLHAILLLCKPGDAMVFYYSGHGVWMNNKDAIDDLVKRGMSQAIVMSNLYAEDWGCLIRDATLKKMFNEFVDAKVKVTTVFDCCFSGNVMMLPGSIDALAKLKAYNAKYKSKSLDLSNIAYKPRLVTPKGCREVNGILADPTDTDGDGVPDCADYQINTTQDCFPVNEKGVGCTEVYPDDYAFYTKQDEYYEATFPQHANANNKQPVSDTAERFFILRDVMTISDKEKIARPSERLNSGFLSLSGTTDSQKGVEVTDASGSHGVFTLALTSVLNKYPVALPVSSLLDKITEEMRQKGYRQTPTFHYDSTRLTGNFIGMSAMQEKKRK